MLLFRCRPIFGGVTVTNNSPLFPRVATTCIRIVDVDKVYQTVKTDMVKRDVEIETVDECVDEIDKLAELIGEM
ncbi:hypothetical protein Tco_0441065 [Tanacetum coccineum]